MTNKKELNEEDLVNVTGGKRCVLYGLNNMCSVCPFCEDVKHFRFGETGGGYAIGAQMSTCDNCGAAIKANTDGTVLYVLNGESRETAIDEDI